MFNKKQKNDQGLLENFKNTLQNGGGFKNLSVSIQTDAVYNQDWLEVTIEGFSAVVHFGHDGVPQIRFDATKTHPSKLKTFELMTKIGRLNSDGYYLYHKVFGYRNNMDGAIFMYFVIMNLREYENIANYLFAEQQVKTQALLPKPVHSNGGQ